MRSAPARWQEGVKEGEGEGAGTNTQVAGVGAGAISVCDLISARQVAGGQELC
jgi:hypothetical protein